MDLSARDIERAKFTFSIYDFEGQGKMDAHNLGDAIRALGLNPTMKLVSKLGGNVRRGEKMLTVEEFLPIYSEAKKDKDSGSIEDFVECLRCYDKCGDGKMASNQLNHILQAYGEKLEASEAERIIKECGDSPDDDGFISYMTFLKKLMAGPEASTSKKVTTISSDVSVQMKGKSISSGSGSGRGSGGCSSSRKPEIDEAEEGKKGLVDAEVDSVSFSDANAKEEVGTSSSSSVIVPPEPASAPAPRKIKKSSANTAAPSARLTEPKSPKIEKKFQMPLISMKTDALIKK